MDVSVLNVDEENSITKKLRTDDSDDNAMVLESATVGGENIINSTSSSSAEIFPAIGTGEDAITFKIYTNDGKDDSSESLIILKNIFSRQLPKMPKVILIDFDDFRLLCCCRHINSMIL